MKIRQEPNVEENVSETYPPVCLIHEENDIPYVYEQVKDVGHGYGLGSDTDAVG